MFLNALKRKKPARHTARNAGGAKLAWFNIPGWKLSSDGLSGIKSTEIQPVITNDGKYYPSPDKHSNEFITNNIPVRNVPHVWVIW
jgi:hypothetical protein